TARDQRLAALADLHAGHAVARHLGALQRDPPAVQHRHAGLGAVVDPAALQVQVAALLDQHAGHAGLAQVALRQRAPPVLAEDQPRRLVALADLAVAQGRLAALLDQHPGAAVAVHLAALEQAGALPPDAHAHPGAVVDGTRPQHRVAAAADLDAGQPAGADVA